MADIKKNDTPITKLSAYFTTTYRVTVLLSLGLIVAGIFSYTTLLKREGFPSINFPVALINVNYLVDSPQQIDEEIIEPIELILEDIEEIDSTQTVIRPNQASMQIVFDQGADAEDLLGDIEQEVKTTISVPQEASLNYRAIDPDSVDFEGKYDVILSVIPEDGDPGIEEVQQQAARFVEEIAQADGVVRAEVIEQVVARTDPQTGEEVQVQESFRILGTRADGELTFNTAVEIGVVKAGDSSAIELSNALQDQIKTIDTGQYEIIISSDLAETVREQISDLETNALVGLLIVAVIMFFVISWRSSIIIALFIPIVLAATFFVLFLLGYTLNVITLFALILVIGIIADDAIVVLEAIDYYKRRGFKGVNAVREAVNDIGVPDVAGTITTVLVFIPMAAISGILGEFIRPIPITVIITLIISVLVGLTIVPFVANILFRSEYQNIKGDNSFKKTVNYILNGTGIIIVKLSQKIGDLVQIYLKKWYLALLVLFLSLVYLGIGGYYGGQLDFNVFPAEDDSDAVVINVSFDAGTSLEQAIEDAREINNVVSEEFGDLIEEVTYLQANENSLYIVVGLVSRDVRDITSVAIAESLNDQIEDQVTVRTLDVSSQSTGGPPDSQFPFGVQVFSSDSKKLEQATAEIQDYLQDQVTSTISVQDTVIEYTDIIAKEDGNQYAVVRASLEEGYTTGTLVQLEERVSSQFNADKLTSLGLPEDAIEIDQGQQGEFLESFNSAIVALGIALFVMYVFLVILFNSYLQPLLIFLAIPFSLPGVFLGLYLTDNSFSFFVQIGLIALIGVVVNNTIVLVSYANKIKRENNVRLAEIGAEAVRVRARPIIATSLTTIGGLLPLALTNPFWEGLAYTIIFGLISSTIMIIFVFPLFYVVIEKIRGWKKGLVSKMKPN